MSANIRMHFANSFKKIDNLLETEKIKYMNENTFHNWLYAIVVVKFDIELGQTLELVYPNDYLLNDKDKLNICFLSFPDSNSSFIGDFVFHFRYPYEKNNYLLANSKCMPEIDCRLALYGYVLFRQIKDISMQRGYFQKSLVILTFFPYHNLFYFMLNLMAPLYFDNGIPALESAANDINQWPIPLPDSILTLPFLGKIIKCRVPNLEEIVSSDTSGKSLSNFYLNGGAHDSFLYINNQGLSNSLLIPDLIDLDIYGWLYPVITQIHLLWELVLICQPILVIANTPPICSNVVESLTHLIKPFKYSSDYRPYFTIHDQDFKTYTHSSSNLLLSANVQQLTLPPIILGVTNPFFAKSLQHWPHVICIINQKLSANKIKKSIKKSTQLQPFDNKTGLYTKYKTFLQKDKSFVAKLFKNRPNEVKNVMIRRHFGELTQSFMIPLERYIASLLPLYDDISPYKKIPNIQSFDSNKFLCNIKQHGPQLTTHHKGDWEGLYKKFFESPNFIAWHDIRTRGLREKVETILAQKLRNVDFHNLYKTKSETEIIDIILNLKDKLNVYRSSENYAKNYKIITYLESQMNMLIEELPQDVRLSIR